MGESDPRLKRLIDRAEIQDQLHLWCRGTARKDWDLVRSIFHADAQDDHGTFNGTLEDFIAWQQRHHAGITQSVHFLGNILVEFSGPDQALVETYVIAYHHYLAGSQAGVDILGTEAAAEAGEFNSRIVGRYIDLFERRDGIWRIARRQAVFETLRADQRGGRCLQPHWVAATRDQNDPWLSFQRRGPSQRL
jgi:hypothetical protein